MIRRGLPIRTSSVVKRRYTIDPSAWDAPMTESAAYWLGFLAGDGSIGNGRIVLSLGARDVGHLDKIKAFLGSSAPVSPVPKSGTFRLTVINRSLFDRLRDLGLGGGKLARSKAVLDHAPEEMLPHFWRGTFDADGGLYRHPRGWWVASLTGPIATVDAFHRWVGERIQIKSKILALKNGISFRAVFTGRSLPLAVMSLLLYGDGRCELDRKASLVRQLAASLSSSKM